MTLFLCLLLVVVVLILLTLLCFCITFYSPKRKPDAGEDFSLPSGKVYEPFWDIMLEGMRKNSERLCEEVYITSYDGLKLHGKYYESKPGAPIELMMHGYRGTAQRDFSVGLVRCGEVGHNALVIEQRASGKSEGHVISFGINERRDCLAWVDYLTERFGSDCSIILTGISMGASTVLMAGGMDLPENVVGILADCGYSSAKAIIYKVCRQLHLPPRVLYPFIKLGAKFFGRFDLEQDAPVEALKRCRVPTIFFHGEDDNFVPCDMSRENYEVCSAPKKLVTIPGAGHGLAYLVDPEKYVAELKDFSEKYWKLKETVTE